MTRWALSGVGMITAVGADPASCFRAFCEGRSGNAPLEVFDATRYHTKRGYEIHDRPDGRDRPLRASRWLTEAIRQAIASAGLGPDEVRRAPILVGTGLRELRSLELWHAESAALGVADLHFGGAAARAPGTVGPVVTLSNACAASSFALALAEDMLALGEADVAIAAGTDAMNESMFGVADRTSADGSELLQPFDRDRKGVILGEGAAAVVLERPERLAARGRRPLAWLRGTGVTCCAYHETAPSLAGVKRAMLEAHRRSGVSVDEIDVLFAHGTGTQLNDENEVKAFRAVFGERATRVPITAIKSMTGHTSGPSGLHSLVTAIETMRQGRIPPTVGFRCPLAEGEGLDIVHGEARPGRPRIAQIDAFGFGGVNAVTIVERSDA